MSLSSISNMSLSDAVRAGSDRPSATLAGIVRFALGVALAALAFIVVGAHAATIDPWLATQLQDGATHEFFVIMDTSADVQSVARRFDRKSRTPQVAAVRAALLDHAARTQAPLRAELTGKAVKHRSFHIVNALLVEGDLRLAEAIAARADVLRLEGNPHIRMPPLPEARQNELAMKALAAVTPGVSASNAPALWALGHTGQGIIVGSQDTGVLWTHPALKSHYLGWNGTTADHNYHWHDSIHSKVGSGPANICGYNLVAPCDDDGHGTHTTGTAVGDDGANEKIGMAPGARWIACRNMDTGTGSPATYLECFEWFLAPYPIGGTPQDGDPARAPHVTINSWGCPASEGCGVLTLQAAVEAQRAAGIMTVGAAGNAGPGCNTVDDAPSVYDATYSIGAYDAATQALASFSSRGPVTADGSNRLKPDIAAPGVNVRSSTSNGSYGNLSGTSMATPHVSGAVALLWSALPQLQRNVDATEALLDSGASVVPLASAECSTIGSPNALWGYGKLDVLAAFNNAGATLLPAHAGRGNGIVASTPAGIACGAGCGAQFALGTPVSLAATADASSLFTGWLGACSGIGACNVVVAPGTQVTATFAPAAMGPLQLDIDRDNTYSALTDGLLVIRYLFGVRGSAITSGALATGATVTDPADVQARLGDLKPLLDVDGNGLADALTDGVLVLRYLFGLRGPGLISDAIGVGATRTTAPAIEAYLGTVFP